MIRFGKNITQAGDQLYDVPLEKIHQALKNPHGEVASLQRKLQAIRAMDPIQYRKLKISLPYIVCAQFQNKVRKKDQFVFTERFLIDIDHLSESDMDIGQLRERLRKDARVEMVFSSPSGDGLKVMFKTRSRITDPNYYIVFYKAFCLALDQEYNLGRTLDYKTHDVSRCCFVSYDPEAYYNPAVETVIPQNYIRENELFDMDQIQEEIAIREKTLGLQAQLPTTESPAQDLSEETLAQIKEKIGQKKGKIREKDYVQPSELSMIMGALVGYLVEINANLDDSRPISYGRQIRVSAGKMWAEINVFYGRKGVRIVGTTKTGSHKEFCKTITDYLKVNFDDL